MKKHNLPSTDARYWTALFVASLLGTIFGDFVSTNLGLGFGTGSIPLGVLFAIVLLLERRAKVSSEAYYWIAIVLTRTAATNLADLATHNLKIGYPLVAACLAGLMAITLLVGRSRSSMNLEQNALPNTDLRYWAAILVASILGTTLGDYVSEGLNMGFATGSLLLGALLAVVMVAKSKTKAPTEAYYWLAVVILRTTGTTTGDFISNPEGLNLGFSAGALLMGVLLVGVLNFRRIRSLFFATKPAK